jgi:hypothetical protein
MPNNKGENKHTPLGELINPATKYQTHVILT